jgi:hypothetical protein
LFFIFLSSSAGRHGPALRRLPALDWLPVVLIEIISPGVAAIYGLLLLVQLSYFSLPVLIYILPAATGSLLPVVPVFLKNISLSVGKNIIIRGLCRR